MPLQPAWRARCARADSSTNRWSAFAHPTRDIDELPGSSATARDEEWSEVTAASPDRYETLGLPRVRRIGPL
jgi:hypothetical protein